MIRANQTRQSHHVYRSDGDMDQVQDISPGTLSGQGSNTRSFDHSGANQLDAPANGQVRSLKFWTKWQLLDYPGGILVSICQHNCSFLTPTPDCVPPQPETLAIKAVTPITCHQSQITGESNCPVGCVHSKWELIDPRSVVDNVHDLAHVL